MFQYSPQFPSKLVNVKKFIEESTDELKNVEEFMKKKKLEGWTEEEVGFFRKRSLILAKNIRLSTKARLKSSKDGTILNMKDINRHLEKLVLGRRAQEPTKTNDSEDAESAQIQQLSQDLIYDLAVPTLSEEFKTISEGNRYELVRNSALNREQIRHKPTRVAGQDTKGIQTKNLAILTVQFYKPRAKNQYNRPFLQRHLKLDKEFDVLSCQRLSLLRDSFCCLTDLILHDDYSDRVEEPIAPFAGHREFGAFLINDVFYCDNRFKYTGDSIKSVDQIIKWASDRGVANFTEKDMNDCRFEELDIQLGFPYLYVHSPHCEHIMMFTKIEFSHPLLDARRVEPDFGKLPSLVTSVENKIVNCDFCNHRAARWLVFNSSRLPHSPFYTCHQCNLSFNYTSAMTKIGSFVLMPAIYDSEYLETISTVS